MKNLHHIIDEILETTKKVRNNALEEAARCADRIADLSLPYHDTNYAGLTATTIAHEIRKLKG